MSEFVHLHNHSHYSLLDGASTIDAIIDATIENKMSSVALTDHGVLTGAIEFYYKAKSKNIKPIIGSEFYIAPHNTSRFDKLSRVEGKQPSSGRGIYNHLVLLAKNEIGYKNLIKLSSLAHTEGYYYKPRIDFEILKENSSGIICLSACPVGVIADYLVIGNIDKAKAICQDYKNVFGDDFYLEIQNHFLEIEKPILHWMPQLAKEFDIKLVATNDNHYVKKEHSLAHNILLLIPEASQNGVQIDYKKLKYGTDEIYFKSASEMQKLFREFPEAIFSTLEISDKCDLNLDNKKSYMPNFPLPQSEKSLETYLEKLAHEGVKKLYPNVNGKILSRLEHELKVINQMGYAGYFLIVQDFINEARKLGVRVGPGRGSAAGSLVSYAIQITTIDPLKYDLLFERFLNPDRISMPDIDIDFTDSKRDLVIQYVKQKYGENAVSQIITFNTLQSKAVLKDVGRVLGIPLSTIEPLTKQIPTFQGKVMELKDAYEQIPDLKELKKNGDKKIQEWLEISLTLEGMNKNSGMHAAGIVIAPGNLSDYVPLFKTPSTELMTQYSMLDLEKVGLLKMDFLGLKTLRIIDKAIELVEKNHNVKIDLEKIPDDDEKIFDLFSKGITTGVFQFESSGMKDALRKLKPNSISDLVAMNALYRPGPMQMIDDFIARKNGTQAIEYIHPNLEPILKETYGIIVYQEQVIKMASEIAGFSLSKADILRRAMGKKDKELMKQQKKEFVEGAVQNKIKEKIAKEIFDLIEKFASYGFNKSHSVAYATVAYQTAYIKSHFPFEFMASTMSCEMDDTKRIVELIDECQKLNIQIFPPDINESNSDFTITKNGIRFGLSAIKGVGENAVENITIARNEKKFPNIFYFIQNVNIRQVNKRTLESLIQSGSFDSLHDNRKQLFEMVEKILSFGQSSFKQKSNNQDSLFLSHEENVVYPKLPDTLDWEENEKLAYEKSVLGFFVSGHPLKKYQTEIQMFATHQLNNIENIPNNSLVKICGVISNVVKKIDKKGNQMAFLTLEDFFGKSECIVFSKVFEKYYNLIEEGNMIMIIGKSDINENVLKIIVDEIISLNTIFQKYVKSIILNLNENELNEKKVVSLRKILENFTGNSQCFVSLNSYDKNKQFSLPSYNVNPSKEFFMSIQSLFGDKSISIS